MRDLYRKLGVDPDANRDAVAAALDRNPELGKYAAILLDDGKRAEYDEAHAALRAIGTLRQKLGLDTGDTWFLEKYPDFAPRFILEKATASAKPPPAEPPVVEAGYVPEPTHKPGRRRTRRSNTPVLAAVITVVLILIVLAIKYL
jgi:hypothetical protein